MEKGYGRPDGSFGVWELLELPFPERKMNIFSENAEQHVKNKTVRSTRLFPGYRLKGHVFA